MILAPDDLLFTAGDAELALVLDPDGEPVRGGVELVTVERIEPATHTQYGDVRIFAFCRVSRTGQLVLKTWGLACGGDGCPKRTGGRCSRPILKSGPMGFLRADASIALARRMTPKERFSRSTFIGKTFAARLYPVTEDDDGQARDRAEWYSKAGPFLSAAENISDGAPSL